MTASASARIDFRNVTLAPGGELVVRAFDLTIAAGEVFCLLGPSGAGKSTLLRAIAGLIAPSGGEIAFSGGGAAVSLMTQDDALLPWLRPVANVAAGSRLRGERPDLPRAARLLEAVGLDGQDKRPDQLSGGMRKRVALARLLYEDRPVALLDEPFAALDAITRREVQALTLRLLAGRTVVLVTHDPFEALAMADRVGVIAGWPAVLTLDETLPARRAGALRDPADAELRGAYERILAALVTP